MAFISNKERASLVKKANKSYTARKVFFFIFTALTLAWLVIIVVFAVLGQKNPDSSIALWQDGNLTGAGYAFIIVSGVLVIAEVIMVILMLSIISPKDASKANRKLESSALSGVKIKGKKNVDKVKAVRARSQVKQKSKKGKKK